MLTIYFLRNQIDLLPKIKSSGNQKKKYKIEDEATKLEDLIYLVAEKRKAKEILSD